MIDGFVRWVQTWSFGDFVLYVSIAWFTIAGALLTLYLWEPRRGNQ